ncbi:MAG: acetyl esterase/lipase [Verrucomicrobiales bacterium]
MGQPHAMRRFWRWLPRWLRGLIKAFLALVVLVVLLATFLFWYADPDITRTNGIVYGTRGGEDLTIDVLQPKRPNGLGIAVMVSGGWKSGSAGSLEVWLVSALLRGGYTLFAICHISQPRATIMDAITDVNRGVRFIRHHADEYGIDPDRLGVTGGSAGGHLSLMLATRGGPGRMGSVDPIDRESSAVQAVAVFYPITDLLNLGTSTENPGDGGPPLSFVKGFGPDALDMPKWKVIGRESSPIYHTHPNMPPMLIHHGDADTLTPMEQTTWFQERAKEQGVDVTVRVHRGGGHGWRTIPWDVWRFARWFDQHLKPSP